VTWEFGRSEREVKGVTRRVFVRGLLVISGFNLLGRRDKMDELAMQEEELLANVKERKCSDPHPSPI